MIIVVRGKATDLARTCTHHPSPSLFAGVPTISTCDTVKERKRMYIYRTFDVVIRAVVVKSLGSRGVIPLQWVLEIVLPSFSQGCSMELF